MRHSRLILLLLLLLPLGCSKTSGVPLVPVSGRILMNDQPLAKATVHYQPVPKEGQKPGPDSMGVTDAEGRYVLRPVGNGFHPDEQGAVAGEHSVRISLFDRTANRQLVPDRYSREGITFTVPAEGTKDAGFELRGQ